MLVAGGNASPSVADVTGVLETVGVQADQDKLATLISEMEGKDIDELIAAGQDKLVKMGGGGGGAAAAAGGDSAGGDAPAAEAEKPKEEEVDAFEGGMDMFGGGGGDY